VDVVEEVVVDADVDVATARDAAVLNKCLIHLK
jgi:hypothetical protein